MALERAAHADAVRGRRWSNTAFTGLPCCSRGPSAQLDEGCRGSVDGSRPDRDTGAGFVTVHPQGSGRWPQRRGRRRPRRGSWCRAESLVRPTPSRGGHIRNAARRFVPGRRHRCRVVLSIGVPRLIWEARADHGRQTSSQRHRVGAMGPGVHNGLAAPKRRRSGDEGPHAMSGVSGGDGGAIVDGRGEEQPMLAKLLQSAGGGDEQVGRALAALGAETDQHWWATIVEERADRRGRARTHGGASQNVNPTTR